MKTPDGIDLDALFAKFRAKTASERAAKERAALPPDWHFDLEDIRAQIAPAVIAWRAQKPEAVEIRFPIHAQHGIDVVIVRTKGPFWYIANAAAIRRWERPHAAATHGGGAA